MSESRRFDYEVQALRDDLDRTKAEALYAAAQARQENTNVITRLGVELNELRTKVEKLLQDWQQLHGRIAAIEDHIAQDAELRPIRIEVQDARWRRIQWSAFFMVALVALDITRGWLW